MDPATAFSVACGVIQLIDFGIKTTKAFHEIYGSKNSLTAANETLDHETQLLDTTSQSVASRLESLANSQLTPEQIHLRTIAEECKRHSQDLLERLDKLKLKGVHRKRDVPVQWFRLVRHKGDIERIQDQLMRCQKLLDTQMLVSLCHGIDVDNETQTKTLQEIALSQIQSTEVFKQMRLDFQALFGSIENNLVKYIQNQGEETRRVLYDLNLESKDRQDFKDLLQSLGFPTMRSRQEDIYDAHPETFGWLFARDSDLDSMGDSFVEWLEGDVGIYWVNGKAGSGKSTLMNFLIEHPDFNYAAETWAGDRKLVKATFFFWRAGNRDQKSINGLLRSLLYQLLSEHPRFFRNINPSIRTEKLEWSTKRLRVTINALLRQCRAENVSICLLIDGLDEFEGHQSERMLLLDIVKELVQSEHIKAVVSSRPEQPFVEILSSCKSLRVQDLNRSDIYRYVEDKLLQEDQMSAYRRSDPHGVSDLFDHIVYKADGVFLWARLAVQDLVSGIWSKDSLSTLHERLEFLNNSLDELFAQLLASIPPVHQAGAANYIRVWAEVDESRKNTFDASLTVLDVAFACHPELTSDIQKLILADQHENNMQGQEIIDRCTQSLHDLGIVLRSRCAGLLDVNTSRRTPLGHLHDDPRNPSAGTSFSSQFARSIFHSQNFTTVNLVHRSAWDFLQENQEGLRFLGKATMSSSELQQGLLRRENCGAACGLFLLQASINAMPETAWRALPEIDLNSTWPHLDQQIAYDSFHSYLKLQWRPKHYYFDDQTRIDYNKHLEAKFHILSTCLKRLTQSVTQKGIAFAKTSATDSFNTERILGLIGSIPATHLSLCLIIDQGGAVPFALEVVNDDYKISLGHFLRFAIIELDSLENSHKPNFDGFSFIHFDYCLKLIQRCLELGLDPNVKAENVMISMGDELCWALPTTRPRFYDADATNWQQYLWILMSISFTFVDYECAENICQQALDLADTFLAYGADCNAAICIEHRNVWTWNDVNISRARAGWSFYLEKSSYQVIEECSMRIRYVNDKLTRKYQVGGAVRKSSAFRISVWEGGEKGRFMLRTFTDEQQRRIIHLAKPHLKYERVGRRWGVSEERRDAFHQLSAAVWEILAANAEHIEKIGFDDSSVEIDLDRLSVLNETPLEEGSRTISFRSMTLAE